MKFKFLSASFLAAILAVVSIAGVLCAAQAPQQAKVTITANGFEPGSINLKANVPAKITFLRTVKDTCATAVVIPDYKIQKDLPLNKPVVVELTPKKGTIDFACGSGMYHGKLVAQ
jgi:plastocyanin domain-containing protein